MSNLLTLLITDVVDSTQLNDELGDAAMVPLWKAHDRAARELMRVWHGQEIARSDGFLVLFGSTSDAIEFALAYHQALRSLDTRMKARVGLHVGPVLLRENSDADKSRGAPAFEVDGVALPVAARVAAAALGAQTLLTATAVQALDSSWSGRLRSHGHWRLKGVAEPQELFECGDPGAPFEPPPDSAKAYRVVRSLSEWVPARKIANNLPAERDVFVGRVDPLQSLAALLDGPARLVTVLGIGGIGKTRLVLRHARAWLGDYPGGAWFCDLSTARSSDGIVAAVAQALNVPLGKSDVVQQIGWAIAAHGPCLVILDTFEQVARHAEATLGTWLALAPEARFIVTSREVLGIAGEHTQVLAPMAEDEGASLFKRRAVAAGHRVAPSGHDEAAIGTLVKLLDGLPLAIELAAARARMMSPRMLLDRMNERFTLLASRGGRLDRQMTLRGALDWSWDLLLQPEKSALAQLSVFEGGFTLEAVEAVLETGSNSSPASSVDLLQSLLDKSFVRQVGDYRFDLLQSVQEYGKQHLQTEGRFEGSGPEFAIDVEIRHGSFFGSMSEDAASAPGWPELDNLVAACRRAVARADSMTAAAAARLAWAALELRGPIRFGLSLATSVLSITGLAPAMSAEVVMIKGRALRTLGSIEEARACFLQALQTARGIGDRRLEAKALGNLARPSSNQEHTEEAWGHLDLGLQLARDVGDGALECELLNGLGNLNHYFGRNDAALASYEQALSLARSLGNRRWQAGILGNLGSIYYKQAKLEDAGAAYEQGIELSRAMGVRQWEGNMLCNLGLLRHAERDSAGAIELLERSLRASREMGQARLEVTALWNLGIVRESTGQLAEAEAQLGDALALATRLDDERAQGQILGYLGLVRTRRGDHALGRSNLEAGRDLLARTNDGADLAILLCCSAEAYRTIGDVSSARKDLEQAMTLQRSLGEAAELDLTLAVARAQRLVLDEAATEGIVIR
jgi:predicted ATPase/class 3 adenylate cyclase/Tfp pilus assembly protein PilF